MFGLKTGMFELKTPVYAYVLVWKNELDQTNVKSQVLSVETRSSAAFKSTCLFMNRIYTVSVQGQGT